MPSFYLGLLNECSLAHFALRRPQVHRYCHYQVHRITSLQVFEHRDSEMGLGTH